MKNSFIKFIVSLAFILSSPLGFGADAIEPFAKYPVTKTPAKSAQGKKKQPKVSVSGPLSKKFHPLLADELAHGPNFALQYRVAPITCGADCSMIAIIDTTTGRVHDPQILITTGIDTENLGERVQFQLKSRLLVLHGCLNEQSNRCGTHQYLFNAGLLKPLKFIPAPKAKN